MTIEDFMELSKICRERCQCGGTGILPDLCPACQVREDMKLYVKIQHIHRFKSLTEKSKPLPARNVEHYLDGGIEE